MNIIIKDMNILYQIHKSGWSDREKKLLHEMLNRHGITDGKNNLDQLIVDMMCMVFIDGIRAANS